MNQIRIKQNLPNLHLIAGKDALREAMQYILFDFDKRIMVAVDGHVLAVVHMNPYLDDIEETGQWYIHHQHFKKLCKKDIEYIALNTESDYILAVGKSKEQIDVKRSLGDYLKFPNYEPVIPEPNQKPLDEVVLAGLNVGVLSNLLQTFDKYNTIVFNPYEYNKGIRFDVRTNVDEYRSQEEQIELAYGVIMPVHFNR